MARPAPARPQPARKTPAAAGGSRPRPTPVVIPPRGLAQSWLAIAKAHRPHVSTSPAAAGRSTTFQTAVRAAATNAAPAAPTPRAFARRPASKSPGVTPLSRSSSTSSTHSLSDSFVITPTSPLPRTPSPRTPSPLGDKMFAPLPPIGSPFSPSCSPRRAGDTLKKVAMRKKRDSKLKYLTNPAGPDLDDLYP